MFILLHNDGVWCKQDSLEEIKEVLVKTGITNISIDEEIMSIDEGIAQLVDYGSMGERVQVNNIELCEYGDDYSNMSIVNVD